jgi:hypothetical protein
VSPAYPICLQLDFWRALILAATGPGLERCSVECAIDKQGTV